MERGYERATEKGRRGRWSLFLMAWDTGGAQQWFATNRKMGSFDQHVVQFWSPLLLDSAEGRRKCVQKEVKQASAG